MDRIIIGQRAPSLYEGVEVPVSEEELDQIEREGGGRSLAEIMADLERITRAQ